MGHPKNIYRQSQFHKQSKFWDDLIPPKASFASNRELWGDLRPHKANVYKQSEFWGDLIPPKAIFASNRKLWGDLRPPKQFFRALKGLGNWAARGWGNLQPLTGEPVGRRTLTHSLSTVSKNPFRQAWLGNEHQTQVANYLNIHTSRRVQPS